MVTNFILRLSLYNRALKEMERKHRSVSSAKLAELVGVNAYQVRKDLSQFGQFGIRGKGYLVNELKGHLQRILGLDKKWCVALVGVGNLGSALLTYPGFRKEGFEICVAFDNSLIKIGKVWEGLKIQDISELKETILEKQIKIAIIAVPASNAQMIADMLVKSGVRGILNFAPTKLDIPKEVKLVNVDLCIQFEVLSYYLSQNEN